MIATHLECWLYGATEQLYYETDDCLLEGPAGTGKTLGLLHYLNAMCLKFPGSQWILFRKHRVDMTEPVLRIWEEEVLGPNHPAITGTAKRAHRESYTYPSGSHVVVMGLGGENDGGARRVMSATFDGAIGIEATELTKDDVELVSSRLRGNKMPCKRLILDCNPGSQYHQLNIRANQGLIRRLRSIHEDNPFFFDHAIQDWTHDGADYLDRLSKLTGARHERLKKGLWVSEEGMIYENWDPNVHVLEGTLLYDWGGMDYEFLPIDGVKPGVTVPKRGRCKSLATADKIIELSWFFGSVDWGHTNPGVLQVWGVDKDRNMYLVAEWYRVKKSLDWWAERAVEAKDEFDLMAIVCDPSEPEHIIKLNERMGTPAGRKHPGLARKANNSWRTGADQLNEALRPQDGSRPKIYVVHNCLRSGRDEQRDYEKQPCCLEEEIPGYVWRKHQDGRPLKEEPEPGQQDHSLDAARYAGMFNWRRDMEHPRPGMPMFPVDTLGDLLKHELILNPRPTPRSNGWQGWRKR